MSDFDHGAWARSKAWVKLNPLPPVETGELVGRLLSGERIDASQTSAVERTALESLFSAEVIEYYFDSNCFTESKQLRAAEERGLVGELFA